MNSHKFLWDGIDIGLRLKVKTSIKREGIRKDMRSF